MQGLKAALHELGGNAARDPLELGKVVALSELPVSKVSRGSREGIRHHAQPLCQLGTHGTLQVRGDEHGGGTHHGRVAVEVLQCRNNLASRINKPDDEGLVVKWLLDAVAV